MFRIGKLLILLTRRGMSPRANQNPSVFRSATKGQGFGSHCGQERSRPAPAPAPKPPIVQAREGSCLEKSLLPWVMYVSDMRCPCPVPPRSQCASCSMAFWRSLSLGWMSESVRCSVRPGDGWVSGHLDAEGGLSRGSVLSGLPPSATRPVPFHVAFTGLERSSPL